LQGNSYANVFLHFEPVGHTERHMGLRKEPKELFEQALQKQQRKKSSDEPPPQQQRNKNALPYYVDTEKEEQWTQDYVYVKLPTREKAKDKKRTKNEVNDKNHPRRIHNLAAMGDLKSIQAMVRENPDIITKKDENGWTPLHEAARSGETEIVEYLCKMLDQESINYRTNNGMGGTALWWALHMFDEDHPTVKVLIRYGARSVAPKSKTKKT
jgi:prolyl 4-hydroxylase